MLQRDQHSCKAGIWKCVLVFLLLALCAGRIAASSELPSLGENSALNIERETRVGHSVYERLLSAGVIETNPLLDRYINDLGYRLLAGIENRAREYTFFIVRDDAVNAFALPGGFIGVNRGLIGYAQTQHQLASVMAHEIAHVELSHGMDMMKKGNEISTAAVLSMVTGILLGTVNPQAGSAVMFGGVAGAQQAMVNYTRENEYEADRMGIDLMSDANFDTNGTVQFFTIMSKLSGNSETGGIEYLRTHPLSTNRIAEAVARVHNRPGSGDQVDDYPLFKDYLQYISSDHLPQQGSPYLRALATMKSGNYQSADPLLGALYESDNENIWYAVAYGENLEYLGRNTDAEEVYRHLLAIFPGDYVLSMRLLNVLNTEGRYQDALQVARRMEIDYPQRPQVYFALSHIYDALNRPVLKLMAEAEFHRLTGNSRQSIRLYDQVLADADADPTTLSIAREKRLQVMEQEKKAE